MTSTQGDTLYARLAEAVPAEQVQGLADRNTVAYNAGRQAVLDAVADWEAEQPEGLNPSGQRLVADIVQANVDSLAATNARIQSIERSRHRATAEALVAIYDALLKQPDEVRTMATERLLDRHSVAYDLALQVIHGEDA